MLEQGRQGGGVKGPRNFSFAQLLFVMRARTRATYISPHCQKLPLCLDEIRTSKFIGQECEGS